MKMPGGRLAPDDIEPGMFVTVLGYNDVLERYVNGPDIEFWSKPAEQTGVGQAFLVSAVDLPFVVLRCALCDCGRLMTFDLRAGDLKRLTQEYVEALKPPKQQADQTRIVPTGTSLADLMARMMGVPPSIFTEPNEPPMQGSPPKS